MGRYFFILLITCQCFFNNLSSQDIGFLLSEYEELFDSEERDIEEAWSTMSKNVMLSWASIDERYDKNKLPILNHSEIWIAKAWRGERINAQALLWTNKELNDLTIEMTDLYCGNSIISANDISANFVRYTLADEFQRGIHAGCSERYNKAEWDSVLIADVIDRNTLNYISALTVRPIWINIWVPQTAKPGKYNGIMKICAENIPSLQMQLELDVIDRILPLPGEWKFHLDMWQNPYAVARYHQVPLWSESHFDILLPLMKILANAGQKVITTSIMHKPWGGQTEDHFDSMITRFKQLDGSIIYDYTVFDKWVDFMLNDVGITEQINCYTMIPWDLSFDYYDQATNRIQFIKAAPGDSEYEDYWISFLKDFSMHLRLKGWFDKTTIAMDERPMEAMQHAIQIIKMADPDFKISLAGDFHENIQTDLYDLSIPYRGVYPEGVLEERRSKGQKTTYYTCCQEDFPNFFTFSPPAEVSSRRTTRFSHQS